ncbi:MAG: hypothetical protein P0Y64_16695 [Candidatus Sphingomonas colombiensis]|nr:hypothetical protein [Sphingomonas sp.]WEK42958.1 MAG: hypothetical protein P0Y64_16695 [Sphingomonas sp.]
MTEAPQYLVRSLLEKFGPETVAVLITENGYDRVPVSRLKRQRAKMVAAGQAKVLTGGGDRPFTPPSCSECDGPVGSRNTSGRCRACANRVTAADPSFGEKVSDGMARAGHRGTPYRPKKRAPAYRGCDGLTEAITALYARVAREHCCSVEAAALVLNYSPAQLEKMAA